MKRSLPMIVTGVIVLSLAAAGPGLARADLAHGLVAHWKLDETTGDAITDSAGNHTGANHGAEPGQPGVLGTAAAFDPAEDDFVDLGESLQLDAGNQVTVSAFVYPESFHAPDSRNRANSRNGILGDSDTRLIFALTDGGRLTFVWDPGDRKYQTIDADPADAVPPGTWSHVAVTRSGSTMMLYVDGVAKKVGSAFSSAPFAKLGRLHLGRVNNSSARDFHGRLDDVRVYDRALSATEIRELAQRGERPKRPFGEGQLDRLPYNHPGLAVDLGVGLWAWPLPMDYDGDGDLDLLVSCHDVPYRGTYFFENSGREKGDRHLLPERPEGCFAQKVPVTFFPPPVFKPGVPIGGGLSNVQVSQVGGKPRLLVPGCEYVGVPGRGLVERVKLPVGAKVHEPGRKLRANQWKYADYDGDGALDLIVGVGDWTDYGWDNAFNDRGEWTNGPLHGYVYLLRNQGTTGEPDYEEPVKIEAGAGPIDVYGMPSPCLEDFDGDGDLDILCGEFVDKLTWFENVGTRKEPKYAAGRYLVDRDDTPTRSASEAEPPLTMPLCMITPTAVDWDGDGDCDLVVGQEDGRVALVENTGRVVDRMPVFAPPRFFRQEAHEVKFGALATPVGFDWDGDGDDDIVSGNTAGEIGFIENLGGCPPKWAAPVLIEADGAPIRIEAGPNGSIQGPCETKWGYTTISIADWDGDGLADVVANTIWGKVHWYRNVGTRTKPRLAAAEPIRVEWSGTPPKPEWNWWNPEDNELATQWRTTPCVVDLTGDGLVDLVMLDHEGYLALYERKKVDGKLVLLPPERVFWSEGPSVFNSGHGVGEKGPGLVRLNDGAAGRSGRRKLSFVDWDRDGRVDLLVNSRSIDWLRNEGTRDGRFVLKPMGPLATRRLAGHTTSPTTVDWDRNGVPDLLVGAEDGYFYYLKNPHAPGSP